MNAWRKCSRLPGGSWLSNLSDMLIIKQGKKKLKGDNEVMGVLDGK